MEQYKLAEKFSPSDPIIEGHIGHAYFVKGDFKQALNYFQKSWDLQPPSYVHYWKGKIYEEQGNFMEAIDEFEKNDGDDAGKKSFYDGLRSAVKERGAEGYWRKRPVEDLKESPQPVYRIATLHARLGEKFEAYECLERAWEQHDSSLDTLMYDTCWDHKDKLFKILSRKIGLMQ